jgi:hypothetical protein
MPAHGESQWRLERGQTDAGMWMSPVPIMERMPGDLGQRLEPGGIGLQALLHGVSPAHTYWSTARTRWPG